MTKSLLMSSGVDDGATITHHCEGKIKIARVNDDVVHVSTQFLLES